MGEPKASWLPGVLARAPKINTETLDAIKNVVRIINWMNASNEKANRRRYMRISIISILKCFEAVQGAQLQHYLNPYWWALAARPTKVRRHQSNRQRIFYVKHRRLIFKSAKKVRSRQLNLDANHRVNASQCRAIYTKQAWKVSRRYIPVSP